MKRQHQTLAGGRWARLNLLEQMANIGSEVERALNWRAKGNAGYSKKAFERSLELIDLTLEDAQGFTRFRELARLREVWCDYFFGKNEFLSTETSWRKYFLPFALAVRKDF